MDKKIATPSNESSYQIQLFNNNIKKIKIESQMEAKMAEALLSKPHLMSELHGKCRRGNNPYQYAKSLKNKSQKITLN